MQWFMGLDSSTQGLSSVIIDVGSGGIVSEHSVNYGADLPGYACPQGFLENPDAAVKHADPVLWAAALDVLFERMSDGGVDFSRIAGISGSGQQHGTVYLNATALAPGGWRADADLAGLVRPLLSRESAPIWMDSSTTAECREITEAAGGSEEVRTRTGSPAIERFSGPQIRKFYKQAPEAYGQTGVIHLVSSFMCSLLAGGNAPIDFGDGAGMNLLNLASREWDAVMLDATAPGLASRLPVCAASGTSVGTIASYFVNRYGLHPDARVVAWSGDNPNSLIGVGGWEPGVAVISLGTSDTYFAAMAEAIVDPAGYGHVFCNPAGGFMSLICFTNGALAREAVRSQHGLDWDGFERCLMETPAGNGGNMMLPYFSPETTPLVLDAHPVYRGTDALVGGTDAAARVRAVVEAQALRLKLHSAWIAGHPRALNVTGGAAANTAICQILADVFDARVERLDTGNSAGLGAAMRAANAVSGFGWAELTAGFCTPTAGMAVTPVPENVAVYERLLPEYRAFAAEYR